MNKKDELGGERVKPFKRDESFRYTFKDPYPGKFQLMIQKENEIVSSKEGHLYVLDLSPKGMKFKTEFNLPVDRFDIDMEIHLKMNGHELAVAGHPIWRRPSGTGFMYGFQSIEDSETEQEIIDSLKSFTKTFFI
ncbi:PilZ domain-containing protein [Bacillus salacetis]|uniref:PilZ domain-containing protein n=1 Tax=Bacillus salacetis TaxID=2315464 RepID=A0A3A1QSQ8_9BACI|nr:PilZ domain-containing protein [Bacillus salacetis]RIW30157.1 PilZ domain-containing protein [Bacillus salacetis]